MNKIWHLKKQYDYLKYLIENLIECVLNLINKLWLKDLFIIWNYTKNLSSSIYNVKIYRKKILLFSNKKI